MVVRLEHVFKDYMQGKLTVPVLKDISLDIAEGEYLAIMGPSGSGKTTLMNILGCLDIATKGSYFLEEKDVSGLSDREMAELRNKYIGFVFQTFHLLPRQSAIENVELPLLYGGYSKKDRRAMAEAALEKVGLADRMEFKPGQLSGGQCQRVAIARAIAGKPKLLLADEPTGALDSKSGEQVMEIFSRLHQEGATIAMITHERSIAECAQKILYIRDGELHREAGR
ncbi:MAG: ABC transporter ATP-binding protein [Clostridiales bacterium]|nr:ABC transporter ATP-binding protein [Clostridiales bacterium]